MLIVSLILIGGFFLLPKNALAINKQINFQGKVVNTDGTNVTDQSYTFLFCIYTTASPSTPCTSGSLGDAIWKESKSLTTTASIFQTNLGDATALPSTVTLNVDQLYLGINFNNNGQMSPLVQFTAAPYAINADNANTLETKTWEAPGTIGSGTPNTAAFTSLSSTGITNLATTAGSTVALGNSTGTATLASGGVSAWTNTGGNLTISTASSGILALTSVGALNLSAGAASTWAMPSVVNALNIDSNTLSIDALDNEIGIGNNNPGQTLTVTGTLGIRNGSYNTIFQAGAQSGDLTYTWPTTSVTGLLKNTAGTLTWDTTAYMANPMNAVGDIIYGGTAGAPTKLADVAAGQPFLSGGVTTAPGYAGYTFSATAAQTYTFPSATGTLAALNAVQSWTAAQTFADATATHDTLGFSIAAVGSTRYAGIFTNSDLTAARTWTLQDNSGLVPLSTAANTLFFTTTGATSVTLPTAGYIATNPLTNIGDLMYASSTATPAVISRLADVAAGQPMVSGGVNTAPGYAGYTFSATAAATYTFPGGTSALLATNGSGASLTSLTAGNLSGTIPTGVLGASSLYIGTTSIVLNRASASQALTGITSIDGSAATLTTSRNIQGVAFNGSSDINIINGTGFVKATGTTLSYDNSTYMANPMNAQGDLIVAGASGAPMRLAGSTNDGYVLKYNLAGNTMSWQTDLQGSGANIAVSDEGTQQTAAVSSFNFTGVGVTASAVGNAVTVNIPGGAGGGVSLAPSTADAVSGANSAIFINSTGTGNLLQLQTTASSVTSNKFIVANNGGVTVNGSDSSIVKESVADFALGTIGSSLNNDSDGLSLADTVSTGIPNGGKGTITTTAQPSTTAAITTGAFSITRADGKYLVLRGGTTGMDIYDAYAGTFTAAPFFLNNAIGAGALALPRPGGLYRVIHGGGATTSSLIDPMGATPVGPSMTVTAKGAGTIAVLRPNGRYLITNGAAAGTTQVYDPILDSVVTGPTATSTTWAAGAVVLYHNDGQALVVAGGSTSNTQLYDPSAGAITGASPVGAFTAGPLLDGNKAAGTCGINGAGSVAFRRQDGKFVILSKVNVWAVYDPTANTMTCNSSGGPATQIGDGGQAIPIQDGRFLIIVGGGSQNAYIYDPSNDSFTTYGATPLTAVNSGAHAIMRQDGSWQILVGGGSQATNNYNTGMPMSDSTTLYTSEDIFSSFINVNSTLWWSSQMEAVYASATNGTTNTAHSTLQFLVRTAHSSNGLQSGCATPLNNATEIEIKNSGDLVQDTAGENCIRVKVQYNRPLPKRLLDERGVWAGTGMVVTRYDEVTPRLYNFKIDNSAVLKRTNFDFSLPNASSPTDPTIPVAPTSAAPSGSGACTSGNHYWFVTFVTNGVESQLSPASVVRSCSGSNLEVLNPIPLGPAGTTARNIYRTAAAAAATDTPFLVGTQADNTTTTYTDSLIDTALGAAYGSATPSGPTMTKAETRVETVNGNMVLPYGRLLPTTQLGGTAGFYMGMYSNAHPQLTDAAGAGTVVIARDDKQFLVIEPNGNFADLYDPSTETFTNQTGAGNVPTTTNAAGVGTGAFALKLASGKFLVYLGSAATTAVCSTVGTATDIYDPTQASGSRFTNGPCLTAGGGVGAQAIQNNDGTYTIMHGNQTTATSIYNQVTNTMMVGPSTVTAISCGAWAIPMGLPFNNQYKVKVGANIGVASNGTTLNYDANAKVFSAGPAFTTNTTGCGSVVFQRPDGYWVATGGINNATALTTTNIIDPRTGQQAVGPALVNGTGRGTTVIPRADGTFLITAGNTTAGTVTLSNVYYPTGGPDTALNGVPMGTVAAAPAGPQMGPIPAPAAPTVGTVASGGAVDVGAHYYKVTEIMGGLESLPGTASAVATVASTGTQTVPLTAIPTGASPYANVTARRIYRTVAGAASTAVYYFVAQLDDNSTTTYSDVTADATIAANPTLPFAPAPASVSTIGSIGTGGAVDVGVHTYKYTFVTNGVESLPAAASATATTTSGNQTVNVTGVIAGPTGTTARNVYRTIASSTGLIGSYRLVGTVSGNSITTFADTYADATLGVPAPAAYTGQGDGSVTFQRPDGKWVLINGGSTPSNLVGVYDAGWYADGQYLSEMMQVPALSPNSTLEWQKTSDSYVRFEARVASSPAALGAASFNGVDNPGGSLNNAGTETWAQVEINFRRDFPTFCGAQNGVYNSGAGMEFCNRTISLPTVMQYQITNGQDLLSLQTDSYNVLRVTSNGGIYSSQQGGFYAGGADLAENYTSADDLQKGEVVSVDSTDVHNVKRSSMAYQKDVLGIVSTAPGFVAGSYTDGSYPIALVGRVPVNVSSENGLIKAGDRITAASIPGYAMRATVAGRVLGTAMESMNLDNMTDCPAGGNGGTDAKCGQITVFVNLADYQGMSVDSLMAEVTDNSLDVDDSAVAAATDPNSPFAEYTSQGKVLDFLENLKNNQANYSAADILAGNINAVGQMVSPLIVTDTLVAKNIKAENIEGLQFIQTGIQSAQDGVASNTTEVNNLGQQITSLQASLKTLTDKSAGLDASTIEDFTTSGGLTVGGLAQFNGPAMFKAVAEFVDKVVFHNNVSFEGQVTFNQDAAGYAIVKEGTDNVVVEFSQEYSDAPIVNANVSLQQIKDDDIRHATENLLLTSDANFIITNVTTKGFEIRINQKAIYDIPFSWTAIAVKDVKTFDASDNTDTPVSADGSQVVPTGTNTNTNPTATEPTVPGATATSSTTAASDLVNTATENTDTAARDTGGSQSVLSSTGITTTNTNATTNTAANVSATTTP